MTKNKYSKQPQKTKNITILKKVDIIFRNDR